MHCCKLNHVTCEPGMHGNFRHVESCNTEREVYSGMILVFGGGERLAVEGEGAFGRSYLCASHTML